MKVLSQDSLAQLILRTEYCSYHARHVDYYHCDAVNLWRDFFRPDQLELLLGLPEGGTRKLIDNESISYDPSWRLRVRRSQWRPPQKPGHQPQPRVGRWYPQGYLAGISSIYPQTLQPMRVVSVTEDQLEVDCNHPLADIPLTIQVRVESIASRDKERGGRCRDWLEEALADGPGMQLLRESFHPDYCEPDRFARINSQADARFYATPRMVEHIDSQARAHLLRCTGELLSGGIRILDLMSSVQSHLPGGPATVVGLGMNPEELQANGRLQQWLIHDLNGDPLLPFAAENFDAVCCHLSFEYLVSPDTVMAEVARVLRPDGLCVVSFSNRWFPEKVTRIWQQLHEFERLGYVLEIMQTCFHELTSTTFRNWPRASDDPHYFEKKVSDPLYLVTGRKK